MGQCLGDPQEAWMKGQGFLCCPRGPIPLQTREKQPENTAGTWLIQPILRGRFMTAAFRLHLWPQGCLGLCDKGLVPTLALPCSAEVPAPLGSWAPGRGLGGWG